MKRALNLTICIFCLLGISRSVMCNYDRLEFKRINVKHGVPHSIINCISQDQEGYIWIGTEDGLAKYDNRKFKIYLSDKNDSTSITANQICLIFEDSHKNLWIGTKYSLELYNRELDNFRHFHFYQEPGNPERVLVRAICQLNDSTYIVGTDGGGVYSFVFPSEYKSSYPIYNRISGNLDKRISSLAKENDSILWVGTFCKGLHQINYNTLEITPKIEDDCQYRLFGEIRTLLNDNDSVLLIGTYGHGLYAYNKTNNLIHHFNKLTGLTSNRIVSIHREDIDKLWIGTDGGGLILIDDNFTNVRKFEHQGFDDKSLSNNAIYSVFSDREDNIWVGNFMGGINFSQGYNPFGFLRSNPGYENSLSNKIVSTVIEDSQKRIWVGTDGNSLNVFDSSFNRIESNILPKSLLEKLDNTPVLSIYEDSKNNMWIGTYLKGMFKYNVNDKSLFHYCTDKKNNFYISNDDVRCFFEDNFGRIWIGTNGGGVNLIDSNQDSVRIMKRKLGDENTLSLDWIRTIIDDSYGLVWVGTMHGLNYYDPVKDKFIRFINDPEDTNSVSDNVIFSIHEDTEGSIWIGTSNGLNLFNRKTQTFKRFFKEHGLPNNTINSIIEDSKGDLWLSTNDGLSRFNTSTYTSTNYYVNDGLLSNSFIHNSGTIAKNGKIYLGSIEGLIYYHPDSLHTTLIDIPIKLVNLRINNQDVKIGKHSNDRSILSKDISLTDHIKLNYKDNVIELDYTSLYYKNPDNIVHRYMLRGFDKHWNIDHEKKQSVTYMNLNPGVYTFLVQSKHKQQEEYNNEASLSITITPPFWQTWIFKVCLILTISGLIFYSYLQRIRHLQRQKEDLQRKISEDQLRYEQEQMKMKSEMLKTEIIRQETIMEHKNSQLTQIALQLTHKNDMMVKIKNKLNHQHKSVEDEALRLALHEINDIIENEFEIQKEWERFENHFNDVHGDFYKKLKDRYPDLSLSYLKLCAYLKLDLSTKEIASLMNISLRGVEKARSRLRKKFELDRSENLNQFISEM